MVPKPIYCLKHISALSIVSILVEGQPLFSQLSIGRCQNRLLPSLWYQSRCYHSHCLDGETRTYEGCNLPKITPPGKVDLDLNPNLVWVQSHAPPTLLFCPILQAVSWDESQGGTQMLALSYSHSRSQEQIEWLHGEHTKSKQIEPEN